SSLPAAEGPWRGPLHLSRPAAPDGAATPRPVPQRAATPCGPPHPVRPRPVRVPEGPARGITRAAPFSIPPHLDHPSAPDTEPNPVYHRTTGETGCPNHPHHGYSCLLTTTPSSTLFRLSGATAEERSAAVEAAVAALAAGKLVVLPTETVYGVAASAASADGLAALAAATSPAGTPT